MRKDNLPRIIGKLRGQIFDGDQPGTILREFQILLDFVSECNLKFTEYGATLPTNLLAELNHRLTNPIDIDFKRKIQKSYPNLHGLWTLLWATGFLVADVHGKKVVLKIDEKMLESWEKLNPVERYFILLETWLVYTSNESTGRGHLGLGSFSKVSMFMTRLPDKGLQVAGNSEAEGRMIPYRIEAHNLAMLGEFGLVSIDSGPANPGEGWNIIRVKRTAFGEALFDLFRMRERVARVAGVAGVVAGRRVAVAHAVGERARADCRSAAKAAVARALELPVPRRHRQPQFHPDIGVDRRPERRLDTAERGDVDERLAWRAAATGRHERSRRDRLRHGDRRIGQRER